VRELHSGHAGFVGVARRGGLNVAELRVLMAPRESAEGAVRFLDRLKAWWDGVDPSAASGTVATAVPAPTGPAGMGKQAGDDGASTPPLDPFQLAQWLWGEGFLSPGGEEYVCALLKPCGLTSAMSMLDLSAELGGAARAVAKVFGTYVTGLERSLDAAQKGMALSKAAKLEKKASVAHYNPDAVELRRNAFDCVFGRGATFTLIEKERLLRVVREGMKANGQLLLTEFVRDAAAPASPALAAWASVEPLPPQLWTVEQYRDCLSGLGFDLRIVEDGTDPYRALIIQGWKRLLDEVDLRTLAKSQLLSIVDAAEYWTRRLAALDSGSLRVYRLYAIAAGKARG
jgi:hypothetical protein